MIKLFKGVAIIALQICVIATVTYTFITFVIMQIPLDAWLWIAITSIQLLLYFLIHLRRKSDKLDMWSYQKEQRIEDKLRDIDFYLKRKFDDYEQD